MPPIMRVSRVYGLSASLSARTGVACDLPVERKRPFSNGLKEVGFEDQPQLARCFRISRPKIVLEILAVGDAFQFVRCARCSFRCVWRCTGIGQGVERTFPEPPLPQNALDHVCLATLDEADDLHLSTTGRTRQWIHFVHTLDQHRPSGNGSVARATSCRLGVFERGTVDANGCRLGLVCFAAFGANAACRCEYQP